MNCIVKKQSVIDLIREKDKLIIESDPDYLLQDLLRIKRPRRVVGIDYDDSFCPVCDLGLYIVDIRIP